MPTIYLIRHAAPERNSAIRYDVVPGPPLTPEGHGQARRTAQFLADKGISQLYHSPLVRTLQTANAIARQIGKPSQETEAIREWERGVPSEEVRQRMAQFWQTLLDQGEEAVAVVSHGGPIEELLRYLTNDTLDLSGNRYFGGATTPLGGVWQIAPNDGNWHIAFVYNPGDFA
ncbi:MAG: histidine phosphatase family protein [Chloroflexi bacterium]|nr:histidine phosphatase family protein [Chloroflexota bacterium]MBP8055693.1 histidine phosphatase family protein [Chloroflexota bacterium]